MFYSARVIITVGSILVPAFLSIQNSTNQIPLYWVTWIMSIFVTLCNGLVTLFKLDKKYFFIHTTLELLHSEGWQYIGLSGRYSSKGGQDVHTHENQFLVFFHMAEKIKMRQVEEEYWKFTDTSGVGNATNQAKMEPMLTPSLKQADIASLSGEKKTAIEGWLNEFKENPQIDIDGTPGPSQISRTSSGIPMPMQSNVPKKTVTKTAVVSIPQVFSPKKRDPTTTLYEEV
jgi:hypothetical protein